MKKAARVMSLDSLNELITRNTDISTAIIGHENCPEYYKQSDIDKMIKRAGEANLSLKVNIPVAFEEHLSYLKEEITRLFTLYDNVKLIMNDWGLIYWAHGKFPDKKMGIGKGCSFTYMDCPWNKHIISGEKEKYSSVISEAHNMCNPDTMQALHELNIDEVELSNLSKNKKAFDILKKNGFTIGCNYNICVVSMMRACHCLRFVDKIKEKGKNCSQYCSGSIILSTEKYFDMTDNKPYIVSSETKKMQPTMKMHANMLFSNAEHINNDFSKIDYVIFDERGFGNIFETINVFEF